MVRIFNSQMIFWILVNSFNISYYRQDLPQAALPECRYCFYSRADFWVFAPQGRHVAPIKVKFGSEVRSSLPNFTLIGSGVGVYGPQNWKKWNFTNIIAPKGRVPCTIFIKFTGPICAYSVAIIFAKFGCFISINGKIINNLLRWGRF